MYQGKQLKLGISPQCLPWENMATTEVGKPLYNNTRHKDNNNHNVNDNNMYIGNK